MLLLGAFAEKPDRTEDDIFMVEAKMRPGKLLLVIYPFRYFLNTGKI